jgi:RNA polymerase sigma-70 factor, ECF subfamily
VEDVEFVRDLYDASYRRLVGQLVGLTGSQAEAEDVVQEAFVRAVNHARTVRRADHPEAWVRTVAVNVARSRWRRMQRFVGLQPRLVDEPASREAGSTDRMAVVEALRRLPAAQREAIVLHHLADLPVHEVASTLGVPLGTIKARLSRGRTALAVLMAEAVTEPREAPRG